MAEAADVRSEVDGLRRALGRAGFDRDHFKRVAERRRKYELAMERVRDLAGGGLFRSHEYRDVHDRYSVVESALREVRDVAQLVLEATDGE